MEKVPVRRLSEGDVYHVFSRGVGKQIVFEDAKDRRAFLAIFEKALTECDIQVLAWCLMDNHFHLLLRGRIDEIARFMKMLLASYAKRFNKRHGRSGHLFQSRYGSEPIDSETYLLQAVRYIHQNPEKAGIAPAQRYKWSSYSEYVCAPRITTTAPVLDTFGTKKAFEDFHRRESSFSLREYADQRGEAAAKQALLTAVDELGEKTLHAVRSLPKDERNRCIARLKRRGLTARQIERLTGVSRSTVARIAK